MEDDMKRFELDDEQTTRLLSLGLESEISEGLPLEGESREELLLELLSGTLPVDPQLIQSLPAALKTLSHGLRSVSGEPIGILLLDSQTSVSVIEKIKDYAKKLGKPADSQAKHDAILALYHAAIASGLVFHDKRVTQHGFAELAQAFASLDQQEWIPRDLIKLFGQAGRICQERKA